MTKERLILFSGPMVRAILSGSKTQTRRIVKPPPQNSIIRGIDGVWYDADCINPGKEIKCPYDVGMRLWVKETFRESDSFDEGYEFEPLPPYQYASDYSDEDRIGCGPWKPSIFMPRAASRITLYITGVRAERLKQISGPDCWAEGIESAGWDCEKYGSVTECYRDLWESINGPGSWDASPYVWVIEFKKL
jgi:hypothetical protein